MNLVRLERLRASAFGFLLTLTVTPFLKVVLAVCWVATLAALGAFGTERGAVVAFKRQAA